MIMSPPAMRCTITSIWSSEENLAGTSNSPDQVSVSVGCGKNEAVPPDAFSDVVETATVTFAPLTFVI